MSSAQKALQGFSTERKELLVGTEEKSIHSPTMTFLRVRRGLLASSLHNKHTFRKVVSVLKNRINLLILGPDAGHLHELWTVSGCEEAAGHREELEGKDDPFCDASQGIWPLNQLVFLLFTLFAFR